MNVRHIITPEYPPQIGGVSDYTSTLAERLAASGEDVHVWSPSGDLPASAEGSNVTVHRELGTFDTADLRRAGKLLDQFPAPRELFVNWVPHGYGQRSLNIGFCRWIASRASIHGDHVDLLVHEPFLEFSSRSLKQSGAAAVHRLMTRTLLRSARRVFISIPAWEPALRPWAPRGMNFEWLPIPSTVAVSADAAAVQKLRARFPGRQLVGHVSTFSPSITELLTPVVIQLLAAEPSAHVLLIGKNSREYAASLPAALWERIHATGTLQNSEVSAHVSACDLMFQPYPDGASTRRTSFMICLSHGRPTLTTTGHLSEALWATTDAARSAPVGNHLAMVNHLLGLLPDDAARTRMSAAARALYRAEFDWPVHLKRLQDRVANR